MTYNAELALAARVMGALRDRLPESEHPALAQAWQELTEEIDGSRSEGAAELVIIQWRQQMRERLGAS